MSALPQLVPAPGSYVKQVLFMNKRPPLLPHFIEK